MVVNNFASALLAAIAGEGHIKQQDSLRTRIATDRTPLSELHTAELIAADINAHELNVRSLAADTTAVIAYRFKCYPLRAARDFGVIIIASDDDCVFNSRPVIKYSPVSVASFSFWTVSIRFTQLPPGTTVPHVRAALSTSLPPFALSLSFTSGDRPHFSASPQSNFLQQPSPASFGRFSMLTPLADVIVSSRARSRSQSQQRSQCSGSPAAIVQPKTARLLSLRVRR